MCVQAVAQLARQPANMFIHSRDVDWNPELMRPRREERRHQRKVIVLTLVRELRATLIPALENRFQRLQVLAQLGHRRLPSHAVAPLDMTLYLRPESQHETAVGEAGEVVR